MGSVNIPLGIGAYRRSFKGAPEIRMLNRFFEQAPTNLKERRSLISRPGSRFYENFGAGAIRLLFSQKGAFDSDLFVVSGTSLYRHEADHTTTQITGTIAGTGAPSAAIMTGPGYNYFFISDGTTLQYYAGQSRAIGTLTLTPSAPPDITTQVIKIDSTHYQWATDITVQTAAGTLANPWLIALDTAGNDQVALQNLAHAVNGTGTPGTHYSVGLITAHTTVRNCGVKATSFMVEARTAGTGGNSIVTTVPSGSFLAWGAGTLAGGGTTHALATVTTPDSVGIVSLATLKSYVLAVRSASHRFYWIEPGEVVIDALNFASAESEPDEITDAMQVGDTVWLPGDTSTEPFYATGDANSAFAPQAGRVYSRGVLEGTNVKVGDSVMLVSQDGKVYKVGAGIDRISDHGIEERIRTQVRRELGV